MLLLRRRVQEPHQPPPLQAPQGLPNPPNPLQEEARHQAVRVPEMRQVPRRQRRLADPREELRPPLDVCLWIRFQAQEVVEGPYQVVWVRPRPFSGFVQRGSSARGFCALILRLIKTIYEVGLYSSISRRLHYVRMDISKSV